MSAKILSFPSSVSAFRATTPNAGSVIVFKCQETQAVTNDSQRVTNTPFCLLALLITGTIRDVDDSKAYLSYKNNAASSLLSPNCSSVERLLGVFFHIRIAVRSHDDLHLKQMINFSKQKVCKIFKSFKKCRNVRKRDFCGAHHVGRSG